VNLAELAPRAVLLEQALQGAYATERELQDAVAAALPDAGREVELGAGRIDFLTGDGVGIEVKIAGAPPVVLRQLLGYAEDERVRGLLLVTTMRRHGWLPMVLRHKPLGIVFAGYL
jgi:hypothetical protein